MENLLQKFCLTLVGVFSIMNFSTYPQRSARNSAYVYGMPMNAKCGAVRAY